MATDESHKVTSTLLLLKELNIDRIRELFHLVKVMLTQEKVKNIIYQLGGTPDEEVDTQLDIAFDEGHAQAMAEVYEEGEGDLYNEGYKMGKYQSKEVKLIEY